MISVSTYFLRDRKRKSTATKNSVDAIAIDTKIKRKLRRCCHQKQSRDWGHIGADLLEYILKKLPLADIIRCRAVCHSWRFVTKTYLSISLDSILKPSPPLVIWNRIFTDNANWCFFDVMRTDGGVNLYLPNTNSEILLGKMGRCVGSSNGGYFLLLDREEQNTLFLFHPMLFSGCAIRFPFIKVPQSPTKKNGSYPIWKALIWADPISDSSYGLVVMHPSYKPPLFAKCGATRFTKLKCDPYNNNRNKFVSIICVKNCIYGITGLHRHYFNAWDCTVSVGSSDIPRLVMEFKPQFSSNRSPSFWRYLRLVESEGEIMLVAIGKPHKRRVEAKGGNIVNYNKRYPMCEVYKMDFNKKEWVRINSLGDRVLFVMELQSMSLSSHEFPQYQRNSIYYRHCLLDRGSVPSLGIFSMEDGSLKLIDANKCY